MVRYLVGRVMWAAWLLFAVTVVTYALFFVIPSPAHSAANGYAPRGFGSPGATARVERSLAGEYLGYLHHLTRGDLGSTYDRDHPDHPYPVSNLVSSAIPPTLSLIAGAMLLWATIGLAVGAWSALRPRSIRDRLGTRFVQLASSAHPVWWGLVLSVRLRLSPTELLDPHTDCRLLLPHRSSAR